MKLFNLYHLNYQISDLNGEQILKEITLAKLKREVDILVIDDEDFPLLDDLKKHEFSIEYKKDITSLRDVEPYSIVLCDIHGVGKFLGSDKEGAYLVSQIKEKYPYKIVVSYTADTTGPDVQKYLHSADNVMAKGTSIEDWAELLTESVKKIANPVQVWKKLQTDLLKENVSTREIALLEDKFVKAIKTGRYESLKKLSNDNNSISKILEQSIPLLIKVLGFIGQ